MASSGPRSKTEAMSDLVRIVTGWLADEDLAGLYPGVKMTPVQRQRVEDAVTELTRRLRLLDKRDPE